MPPAAAADLAALDALALRQRLERGETSAGAIAEACLRRVDLREPVVAAFTVIDRAAVRRQAAACDEDRRAGRPLGPLHGIPIGVKDIVDTADLPTENGTPLDAGRRPEADAAIMRRLRAAGAVVMGKTVTTELAAMHPRATRNPHDPEHTPGGSSSGSAAAVAAGMVPLAVGTQTNGSVIRPAAFCGVVGYKPSFGLIPRTGILMQARPLDTVGVFARSVADAAMLAEALAGRDEGDPDSVAAPPPRLVDAARARLGASPRLAFVKSPVWEQGSDDMKAGIGRLARSLAAACEEAVLPGIFAGGHAAHATINLACIARNYRPYYQRGRGELSPYMQKAIEDGGGIAAVDYLAALDMQAQLRAALDAFLDRYDAIITPAAPGEAPRGIGATGNPAFNSLWSLCGAPALSLPLLKGANGLPIGVQVVGRRGGDERLLTIAAWLADTAGHAA